MRIRKLRSFLMCGCFLLLGSNANAQMSTAKDCLPVLTKDYYEYAQTNNLAEDYLRSIDAESWETLQHSNDLSAWGIFQGGMFSLSDSYKDFNDKRTKYLDSVNYHRTQEQALNILQTTTSDRAYTAYEHCLETTAAAAGGSLIRAWPRRETMSEIDLIVKYVPSIPNPKSKVRLHGVVVGGSVAGAPAGHLWNDNKEWGINQEFPFTVERSKGTSETKISIVPEDGSGSVQLTFVRADAKLTLSYVGTTDVLHTKDRSASIPLPNNDNDRRTDCLNFQGKHDGKWCTSQTVVKVTTSPPYFFQNARPDCKGGGCQWSSVISVDISADKLTAQATRNNWGPTGYSLIVVDEYEHMSQAQCGPDVTVPAVEGRPVLFTAVKECLPIATIKWTLLTDNSQGAFRFGCTSSEDGKFALDGSMLDNNTVVLGSYKLVEHRVEESPTCPK